MRTDTLHQLEPKHARNEAYIRTKHKHPSQADMVFKMIQDALVPVCSHRVKHWIGKDLSTVSRILNTLHGGKNGTQFPVRIQKTEKWRSCQYCWGKGPTKVTHYIIKETTKL